MPLITLFPTEKLEFTREELKDSEPSANSWWLNQFQHPPGSPFASALSPENGPQIRREEMIELDFDLRDGAERRSGRDKAIESRARDLCRCGRMKSSAAVSVWIAPRARRGRESFRYQAVWELRY